MLIGFHIWGCIFGGLIYRGHINGILWYDNIRKMTTGQGDDYTTGCLLDIIISKKFIK